MSVLVNGAVEAAAGRTIAEILAARNIDPAAKGTAVALNEAVLPRAQWDERRLRDGDRVEIVRPFSGG